MCIRDRSNHAGAVAIGRDAATHAEDVIATGRSALYDSSNNSTRNGAMLKLPVRSSLPDLSSEQNDSGEWTNDGLMCIYVPSGSTPGSSDSHIAVFFNGDWRNLSFGTFDP